MQQYVVLLQKLIIHAFSKDEMLRLLGAARAESQRDWAMILVAYIYALRVSEVIALKPDSISGTTLIVRRKKGSLKTEQELFEHPNPLLNVRQAMFEILLQARGNQRLFPISRVTFWRRMQKYCAFAGLPGYMAHPHTLKHSRLSQMIETATIAEVQAWGGHKSMSSTGKYLHPKPEQIAAAAKRTLGD